VLDTSVRPRAAEYVQIFDIVLYSNTSELYKHYLPAALGISFVSPLRSKLYDFHLNCKPLQLYKAILYMIFLISADSFRKWKGS
jgi:hypothetical protein